MVPRRKGRTSSVVSMTVGEFNRALNTERREGIRQGGFEGASHENKRLLDKLEKDLNKEATKGFLEIRDVWDWIAKERSK